MSPGANDRSSRWAGIGLGFAWLLGLGVALVALRLLGRGDLSTPPLGSFDQFRGWLEERGTASAAFALLRILATAIAWYLLATTSMGLAARIVRRPGLVRLTDLTTLPVVRRLLGTVAGLGLSATAGTLVAVPLRSLAAPPAAASASDDATTPPGDGRTSRDVGLRRLPDGDTVVMRRITGPDDDGTATMRVAEDQPAPPAPIPRAPAPPAVWRVKAGDNFWDVAQVVLCEAWRRPPTDAESLPYWRLLIEHNRRRLLDPANADLVFVGQELELPAPPPAP